MFRSKPADRRSLKLVEIDSDLAVIGGGLGGVCCAITAARAGLKVTLVQDRPVLGGNASSEVRLWILGATSHLGNNNRWAREGGVIDEILVENLFRNPEGNPLLVDALLLEKVASEPNITLLLNTSIHEVEKSSADTIRAVHGFCSQNSTLYTVSAPLFCDASGDGIVGFLAGAAFRIGAEARSEFGEKLAQTDANGELLGHSIYFYSKDVGRPIKFVPPAFAYTDITHIPRFRDFNASDTGCKLWWIEWGGQLDTVHDTETIKWELWKVVYGVWHYIKNSGNFPEAATLTLEWVGTIPGKRESRRFEGDYMLSQQDLIEQREHPDAVSFGGWAIDLHPSEGVFSEQAGCTQWHSKGVYQIPYRCLYSRNITNLFLGGRIISASHIAFGSTRVMATCAHNGQAAGMAAALCVKHGLLPAEIGKKPYIKALRQALLGRGQYIPGAILNDPRDLARYAALSASSELALGSFPPCGETRVLEDSCAMMLPLPAGAAPRIAVFLDVLRDTELCAELRISGKAANHTPDITLKTLRIPLKKGLRQEVWLDFGTRIEEPRHVFATLCANPALAAHLTDRRVTGVLFLSQRFNGAVAKSASQQPPPGIGIDAFDFWLPERRPGGRNLALSLDPPVAGFAARNLTNGLGRPTGQANAWVAAFEDPEPAVTVRWPAAQTIRRVELTFDTDYDHPLESVLMGHPERTIPFCIPNFRCHDSRGELLFLREENHQSRRVIEFPNPVTTDSLHFRFDHPSKDIPAALFELRIYG